MVSLRVFRSEFDFYGKDITDGYLPFIKEIVDHGPKLEFVGIIDYDKQHYGKRVSGEWVLCDVADFKEAWVDQPIATYS